MHVVHVVLTASQLPASTANFRRSALLQRRAQHSYDDVILFLGWARQWQQQKALRRPFGRKRATPNCLEGQMGNQDGQYLLMMRVYRAHVLIKAHSPVLLFPTLDLSKCTERRILRQSSQYDHTGEETIWWLLLRSIKSLKRRDNVSRTWSQARPNQPQHGSLSVLIKLKDHCVGVCWVILARLVRYG